MTEKQKQYHIENVGLFLTKSQKFLTSKFHHLNLLLELILFAYLRNIKNTNLINLDKKIDSFVSEIATKANIKLY